LNFNKFTDKNSSMKYLLSVFFIFLLSLIFLSPDISAFNQPLVVAHRGASGYLPEHSLPAVALAFAMGVDYIEQDVVLTRDRVPVVLHDIYLDTVTDVSLKFPGRARKDGRYYVIDFTLDEIRQLHLQERINLKTGKAVYPGRFPAETVLPLKIPTLEEELMFIRGLEKSSGKAVGIYTEIKAPRFHHQENMDIEKIVLELLDRNGYNKKSQRAYLQSFDPRALIRLHGELGAQVKLVQLIGPSRWNTTPGVDYEKMLTRDGLQKIDRYAQTIGVWWPMLVDVKPLTDKGYRINEIVSNAKKAGLDIHVYTLRKDDLPSFVKDFQHVLEIVFDELKVDGCFTDFPDLVISYLRSEKRRRGSALDS
jgi:glycerophosphoryl diester phosphodiesterase